ncbi:Phosphatidic acid phosphatase type 2/haloperoxidase [Trinorchestia longiramus]|nr:Phosphatidic acid phosphatase type 2/haloperoxidase [Trinorchestia longiramus]
MASDATLKAAAKHKGSYHPFIVLAGVLLLILSNTGVLPISYTSILCDDPSIRRVLTTETVHTIPLFAVATIVPFVNIFLLEWMLPGKASRDAKRACSVAWGFLKDAFVGQLITLLVVEFFKMTVSEARPHFIQSCGPQLSDQLCNQGYVELTWENCTNPLHLSHPKLIDTMKSFPSGHAAMGAFIATFMGWYLVVRLKVRWSKLLGASLALLWGAWGAFCGVSRIWDNRHHWWDVLAGATVGVVVAAVTIKRMSSKLFSSDEKPSKVSSVHPTTQSAA